MSDLNNLNNNDISETDVLYVGPPKNVFSKESKTYNINLNKIYFYIMLINFILYIISLVIIMNYYKNKITKEEGYSKYVIDIQDIKEILPRLNLSNDDGAVPSREKFFKSRILYINDKNLSPEYVKYFKTLCWEEEKIYNKKEKENEGKNFEKYFENKTAGGQLNYSEFYYLCKEEKLLYSQEEMMAAYPDPFISIILPAFNKEKELLQSIRSIQNQSFRNIEIIIVDDCSTDNSKEVYKYLLDTDARIRIFYHQKNMGVWRTRLDGFLYSRGKYILFFDPGDFYADNLVLEDGYNLVNKYHLDSVRFALMEVYNRTNIEGEKNQKKITFYKEFLKITYGRLDLPVITVHFGSIWNRLTRAAIFTKGLYLLDEYILNAYKNLWEDRWWNQIANKMCFSNLIVNRIAYLYFRFVTGEGSVKLDTDERKFKTIKEFIYFLLFDYEIHSKHSDKKDIINFLRALTYPNFQYFEFKLNLSYLNQNFPVFFHLINCLLKDPFVYDDDKKFLENLKESIKAHLDE